MVKELCLYYNYRLNYDFRNALYSGVAKMRKMGLKIAIFTIRMLIHNNTANSKTYVNTHLKPENISNIPLNIENDMISIS